MRSFLTRLRGKSKLGRKKDKKKNDHSNRSSLVESIPAVKQEQLQQKPDADIRDADDHPSTAELTSTLHSTANDDADLPLHVDEELTFHGQGDSTSAIDHTVSTRFKEKQYESVRPTNEAHHAHASSTTEQKVAAQKTISENDSTLYLSPIHEEIWRKAYHELKQDTRHAKYVDLYEKLLFETISNESTPSFASGNNVSMSPEEVQLNIILEKGQEKIKKYKKAIESSSGIVKAITPIKTILDIPLKNVPQTSLPWAVISSSIDILIKPTKSMDTLYNGVQITTSKIQWYAGIIDRILRDHHSKRNGLEQVYDKIKNKVIDLYQALLFYQIKSVCSYWKNQLWVLVRSALEFDNWDADLEEIEKSEKALEGYIAQYKGEQVPDEIQILREIIHKQWQDDDDVKCKQDLCVVNPQTQMSHLEERKDTMIRASYSWALETPEYKDFTDWTNRDAPSLLWVNGQAGTGKTMLLMGIIRELAAGQLSNPDIPDVLYFFLQKKVTDANSGTAILRSFIWLLLSQQPGLIRYVLPEYRRSGKALFGSSSAFSGLSKIFKKMLQDDQVEKVVLAIDALDECREENDEQQVLLRFLNELMSDGRIASKVRFLVSSRPVWEIQTEIIKETSRRSTLELDNHSLESPINAFIDEKGRELEGKTKDKDRLTRVTAQLRLRASNTFIWVSLVCKELSKTRDVYWEKILDAAPKDLTNLYNYILFERLNHSIFEDCKKVLAVAMMAFRPLTINEIQQLAEIPDCTASGIVQDCSSFFTVQEDTVYFFHQSAQDYLNNHFEQLQELPRDQLHLKIFRQSLRSMKRFLKKNIYDLTDLGRTTKPQIAPADPLDSIRYSCRYWAQHLRKSPCDVVNTRDVYSFFCEHFLHWLEAMSFLGLMSKVIKSIEALLPHVEAQNDSDMVRFLTDAKRFVLSNYEIATHAPLQLYVSCLVFAPTKSIIRQIFKDQIPSWIPVLPKARSDWDALLQTFENGDGNVCGAAFSRDTSLLTIVSDNSIEMRNTDTGHLRNTYYPWDTFMCGAPSGDQKLLAWVDLTLPVIRLWDIERECLYGDLDKELDQSAAQILMFSPDDRVLASISPDTLCVWDIDGLDLKWSIDVEDTRLSLTFTSCGGYVAFRHGKAIQLREATTGKLKFSLDIPTGGHSIHGLGFAPDGQTACFSLSNESLSLLDLVSGKTKSMGPCPIAKVVVFSPDCKLVAVATGPDVRLYSTVRGTWLTTVRDISVVSALAISPDGRLLASSTSSETSVFDITLAMEQSERNEWRSSSLLNYLVLSPTGQQVAVWSRDHAIRILEPKSGKLEQTLRLNYRSQPVVFSLDGHYLALLSGSLVTLWNTADWSDVREIPVSHPVDHIRFTETGIQVSAREIERPTYLNLPVDGLKFNNPVIKQPQVKLGDDTEWVVRGENDANLLWMPTAYRPNWTDSWGVYGSLLVYVTELGQVYTIEFDLSKLESEGIL